MVKRFHFTHNIFNFEILELKILFCKNIFYKKDSFTLDFYHLFARLKHVCEVTHNFSIYQPHTKLFYLAEFMQILSHKTENINFYETKKYECLKFI